MKSLEANEHPAYTHRATMTISSDGDNGDVAVQITFSPDMEGKDIVKLGYIPAAFEFVQGYVLPALEEAYLLTEHPELSEEPPSDRRH